MSDITLEQFKKFADENDILWFYNVPHWNTKSFSGKPIYDKDVLAEIKKNFLEDPFEPVMHGVMVSKEELKLLYHDGTVEDLIVTQKLLNHKKNEVKMKVMVVIAEIAHKVNREYCIKEQIEAPPRWNDLSDEGKESIIAGVAAVIENPKITPAKLHDNWLEWKKEAGWKYGKVKDEKAKTHPCMVEFKKLPKVDQEKDALFIKTVKAEIRKK